MIKTTNLPRHYFGSLTSPGIAVSQQKSDVKPTTRSSVDRFSFASANQVTSLTYGALKIDENLHGHGKTSIRNLSLEASTFQNGVMVQSEKGKWLLDKNKLLALMPKLWMAPQLGKLINVVKKQPGGIELLEAMGKVYITHSDPFPALLALGEKEGKQTFTVGHLMIPPTLALGAPFATLHDALVHTSVGMSYHDEMIGLFINKLLTGGTLSEFEGDYPSYAHCVLLDFEQSFKNSQEAFYTHTYQGQNVDNIPGMGAPIPAALNKIRKFIESPGSFSKTVAPKKQKSSIMDELKRINVTKINPETEQLVEQYKLSLKKTGMSAHLNQPELIVLEEKFNQLKKDLTRKNKIAAETTVKKIQTHLTECCKHQLIMADKTLFEMTGKFFVIGQHLRKQGLQLSFADLCAQVRRIAPTTHFNIPLMTLDAYEQSLKEAVKIRQALEESAVNKRLN